MKRATLEFGGECGVELAVTGLVDQVSQLSQVGLEQALGLHEFRFHEGHGGGADGIAKEGVELGMHLVAQAVHAILDATE